MEIGVYATLRDLVGSKIISVDGASEMTVGQMIDRVLEKYPALSNKLLDKEGDLHPSIHVFINGRDAHYMGGLEAAITAEDEVRIFPPVGGGW